MIITKGSHIASIPQNVKSLQHHTKMNITLKIILEQLKYEIKVIEMPAQVHLHQDKSVQCSSGGWQIDRLLLRKQISIYRLAKKSKKLSC